MLRHHIIERCYNSHKDEKWYGNIEVCGEWQTYPQLFYQWALDNGWKKGLTIDRFDSDKDYEASNCQFITHSENSRKAMDKIKTVTEEQVRKIRSLYGTVKMIEISRLLKVSYGNIKAICYGKSWKHIK